MRLLRCAREVLPSSARQAGPSPGASVPGSQSGTLTSRGAVARVRAGQGGAQHEGCPVSLPGAQRYNGHSASGGGTCARDRTASPQSRSHAALAQWECVSGHMALREREERREGGKNKQTKTNKEFRRACGCRRGFTRRRVAWGVFLMVLGVGSLVVCTRATMLALHEEAQVVEVTRELITATQALKAAVATEFETNQMALAVTAVNSASREVSFLKVRPPFRTPRNTITNSLCKV